MDSVIRTDKLIPIAKNTQKSLVQKNNFYVLWDKTLTDYGHKMWQESSLIKNLKGIPTTKTTTTNLPKPKNHYSPSEAAWASGSSMGAKQTQY